MLQFIFTLLALYPPAPVARLTLTQEAPLDYGFKHFIFHFTIVYGIILRFGKFMNYLFALAVLFYHNGSVNYSIMKTYPNSVTNTHFKSCLQVAIEVKIQGGHVLFKNSNFCVSFLHQELPRASS